MKQAETGVEKSVSFNSVSTLFESFVRLLVSISLVFVVIAVHWFYTPLQCQLAFILYRTVLTVFTLYVMISHFRFHQQREV